MRRKHRYYIDVTFNLKVGQRNGAKALELALDQVSRTKPIYANDCGLMIDKLSVVLVRDRADSYGDESA